MGLHRNYVVHLFVANGIDLDFVNAENKYEYEYENKMILQNDASFKTNSSLYFIIRLLFQ